MQISSSKQPSKKNMVEMLVDLGYSIPKAENLYKKYKEWGKLDKLQDYIEEKRNISYKVESYPLKDM